MSKVLSGQVVVTTAGTAVPFTTAGFTGPGTYLVKPMGGNTGTYCYIGEDGAGDVTSSNGLQLKKGIDAIVITATDLSYYYVDSDTSGDKVCWLRVMGEGNYIAPPAA